MNHITPLLLRLTVDMVVAWKQGLSSKYTKFAKSKRREEQRCTFLLVNCNCQFEIFMFLKYFSVILKKTTKYLILSKKKNLREDSVT